MSFLSDTEWPQKLQRLFEILHTKPENTSPRPRYDAGYSALLSYCFRNDLDYTIAPQAAPTTPEGDTDSVIWLQVLDRDLNPVLLVAVSNESWISQDAGHDNADAQMRDQYDRLLGQCPLPRLYGLTCLGTKLCIYKGDPMTGDVTPPCTLSKDHLEMKWTVDIFSSEGFIKMQEIVKFIREGGDHT